MTEYSKGFLVDLYRRMLTIRLCEESLVEPILSGEIKCPVHLCTGQEAVAVGICAAIEPSDYVFGNHRSHGHYLAKGGDMKAMVAEIYCKADGCARGRGGSMHLIDTGVGMLGAAPIVAGTISLAVGAALGSTIRGENRIAVSFFGDGAAGEGVLYESINLASLKRLPVIFVCENNFYSTHMPICECRLNDDISQVCTPCGVPSHRIDGNDVLEVYETAARAVAHCRSGAGPVFIECTTYRLRGHVGPDDNIQGTHTDIRPAEEIRRWKKKDPLIRFHQYLIERDIADESMLESIKGEIGDIVAEAHRASADSPFPEPDEVMKHVFKAPQP